ncbi:neutral zinc metallopeptidase [Leifsonia sp. YIM 134122]|uniref:Neutral zinc metallopeptidase n=1 Tax=Leifsonia stereocauli TaxID=3134136 RepID=A0ABU9W0H1_9MICO
MAAAAAMTVLLTLTGCTGLLGGLYSGGNSGPISDSDRSGDPLNYDEIDGEIENAIDVVDTFWSDHFADFYEGGDPYTPPSDFIPYIESDLPTCGGEQLEPGNAFYCVPDNTILWDQDLMDYLYTEGGDSVVYLVIAHEWGHAIQEQISEEGLWNSEELQADCFAAAALYGAADDGTWAFETGDTAEITNALTFLADETEWTDSDDHGDPLDRIDAFNDGRTMGVEGCHPVEE